MQRFEAPIAVAALLAIVGTGIFGTPAAGVFIFAALLLVAFRPLAAARDLLKFWPLLVLPLVAIASTLWSDAPERTMRAALQFMLTCIAAIMVCRRLAADHAILTLFIGYGVLALIALPSVPASLAGGTPLLGPFDSKNQMGFSAHLLVALALAVIFDRQQPSIARFVAAAAVPLGLGLLVLSNSAGAVASVGITFIAFPALMLLGRLSQRGRLIVLLLLIVALVIGSIFLSDIEAAIAAFRENVLKKDATLTGRTYLWEYADQLNRERPWLGGGYYAFWRHGNLGAEGLWRWGGIASRSGFNFHNAFIEMQVDLGWVGLGILVAMCIGIAGVACYRQFTRPTVPMAFFLAFLAVTYARSLTETGMIAPFSAVTVFCLATVVYARAPDRKRVDRRRDRAGPSADRGALPARRRRMDGRQPRAPARA
ncbi:O-antigen ligase family protein [Polymorphobacter fuscus]|uniref:O-antigen ligase family protein n=1 Tax=Sandarakinorhabdus fusca TaxID=1439888 RepID=UPI001431EA3F|nr:O-antigen ligase family protein [Polymorphobacter fuscus]NJC08762.1 exopolysaccharide production protein ExoQ [Polymorphobacter fuscus]